jgi:UDP-N-acetylmuramoylalanine--D-glutamate ligase
MNAPAGIDVRGKRALVYSLGMEGRDLASWLMAQGARVTMSDTRTKDRLKRAGASAPEGVERVYAGQALLDPDGFEVVAVSQSILRHDAAVVRARQLGIPVVSQMQLFLRLCPGRVVGTTGSNGKSTTTALVAAMAKAAGIEHVVGGNIGEALLGRLDEIRPQTTVILEISHTQLQYTDRSPRVAAVTNVTPNHLDQFSWDEYVGLKRHIFEHQRPGDTAVLNLQDEVSAAWAPELHGVRFASTAGDPGGCGAWLDAEGVIRSRDGDEAPILHREELRLRGEHNVANAVMACAIGSAMGLPREAMAAAAASFRGVPHRLEVVGTAGGVTWVNDSIATAPERTIAGLRAFHEPVVLLLGGREKKLPMEGLAALARERCRAVVCFGESGGVFRDAMAAAVPATKLVSTLEIAVKTAAKLGQPGDVVLLSPAGTSFDAYPSFEARGAAFRELVSALPGFEPAEVAP